MMLATRNLGGQPAIVPGILKLTCPRNEQHRDHAAFCILRVVVMAIARHSGGLCIKPYSEPQGPEVTEAHIFSFVAPGSRSCRI